MRLERQPLPVFRPPSSVLGIDASRALSTAPTGTENYSREIISALLQQGSAFRFRLYTRAQPPANIFPNTINYEIRAMPFPRLWTHARLSAEMLMRAPDALFVPAHVLPLIHPRRSFVTVHDLGYLHFPQAHRLLDRLYLDLSTRWNTRSARRIIADSNATRDDLVRFYRAPREKIRVVYPGYDAELFQPERDSEKIERTKMRYGISGEYVIAVGTLHPRKNYARLVEAFRALPGDLQLVIVGKKGWLFQEIFAQVIRFDLQTRVTFLDYVEAKDLPALYSGARLCVFPSLYEGFGFPVLEAQACGIPVACSNTSSLPEVAGDAAEYFDPLDTGAITAALALLLDDARSKALIAKGRTNVERFSWKRAARELIEIFTRD